MAPPMLLFLAPLLFVVLLPEAAWAWGPVAHLTHGAAILDELSNLPLALQRLLGDCRWEYLYGCIGADIIQVKRYTRSIYTHCHNWRMGWKVLEGARSKSERAFAYGYLSHLAADVYSHNYFVPIHLIQSFPSQTRRHIYWEARFDSQFRAAERALLADVLERRYPECDALVERVIEKTLFSFRTNKRIFHSLVALQRLDRWQTALRRVTARSRFALPEAEVHHYNELCTAAIRDLLQNGENAVTLHHDPTGHESLRQAKEIRRKLRALRRREIPIEALRRRFLEVFTSACRAGEPVTLPELPV